MAIVRGLPASTLHPDFNVWMEESYREDIAPYGVELELHHYVRTYDALVSILCSRALWASEARRLNDSTEFEHALPMVYRALDDVTDSTLIEHAQLVKQGLTDRFRNRIFVSCFSRACDIKDQWDDYANDQTGFALTFDSERLSALRHVRLMPVEYDPAVQEARIRSAVHRALGYVYTAKAPSYLNFMFNVQSRFTYLSTELYFMCITFKAAKWSKECEWRLIYTVPEGEGPLVVEHRASPSGDIPYVALDLTDTYIPKTIPIFAAVRGGPRVGKGAAALIRQYLREHERGTRWFDQPPFAGEGSRM